ncbi:MAG: hypothetical protein JWM31_2580, partial [Solirubrobacterales bacterium]|nr:hypothetical protein [Solirubrobacterales bacterium]
DGRSATIAGVRVTEGELLAVDGDRGLVCTQAPGYAAPESDAHLAQVLAWRRPAAAPAATVPS